MASAISSGGAMEDFSGKNQDAASFNRVTSAFMHYMHGGSLSATSGATADTSSF